MVSSLSVRMAAGRVDVAHRHAGRGREPCWGSTQHRSQTEPSALPSPLPTPQARLLRLPSSSVPVPLSSCRHTQPPS